jgi:uncharacterized membrane protein
MVAVHVQQIFGSVALADSAGAFVVELLGGPPAAPVFVFLMGVFLSAGRPNPTEVGVRRGALLLLLGYTLNLVRGTIPIGLGLHIGRLTPEAIQPFTPVNLLLAVDILIFAGLACIVLALVVRWVRRPVWWLVIAAAVILASPLLWGVQTGIGVIDHLIEPLWGSAENTSFPLLPWLFYPLCGMAYGQLLVKLEGSALARVSAAAGAAALLSGVGLGLIDPERAFYDYARMNAAGHLAIIGFVLLWIAGFRWVAGRFDLGPVARFLRYLSRNVTPVYVAHWIIIGWSTLLLGFRSRGWLMMLACACAVTALSCGIAALYSRLPKPTRRSHPGTRTS